MAPLLVAAIGGNLGESLPGLSAMLGEGNAEAL